MKEEEFQRLIRNRGLTRAETAMLRKREGLRFDPDHLPNDNNERLEIFISACEKTRKSKERHENGTP